MKKNFDGIKKHFTKHYKKAIEQDDDSPHSIAIGFAIGTFIAVFPTFGLGILIILGIMIFYKTMNKIAAIAGVAFWNIFMIGPIIYFSPKIGAFILRIFGFDIITTNLRFREIIYANPFNWGDLWIFLKSYSEHYLIGNTILSITISIACYFLVKSAVISYRKLKSKK